MAILLQTKAFIAQNIRNGAIKRISKYAILCRVLQIRSHILKYSSITTLDGDIGKNHMASQNFIL